MGSFCDSGVATACPAGLFTFRTDGTNVAVCQPCPPGLICSGGANVTTQPGYWRYNGTSTVATRCLGAGSSLLARSSRDAGFSDGSSCQWPDFGEGDCGDGYIRDASANPLCAMCDEGYARSGDACSKCPELVGLFVAFAALLALLITLGLIFRQLVRAISPGARTRVNMVVAKILLQYWYVLASVGDARSRATRLINSVVSVPTHAATDAISGGGHWGGCMFAEATFQTRYFWSLVVVPACMVVVAALVIALVQAARLCRVSNMLQRISKLAALDVIKLSTAVVYFMTLSTLSSTLLKATQAACIQVHAVGGTDGSSTFLVSVCVRCVW